jgi:ribosomal protein L10
MSFDIKAYKRLKIKHYLKKINLFFFFHGACLNTTNWIKVEQVLNEKELKYFWIINTLTSTLIKNSIFKNLTSIIHGPILLLHMGNAKLILKKFNSINLWISLLCLKLNNNIYSNRQIKKLDTLSYTENVYFFYNSMQSIVKIPYSKLKNKKVIRISK